LVAQASLRLTVNLLDSWAERIWGESKETNPVFDGGFLVPSPVLAAAAGATGTIPVSNSGFVGGGQIGYNYQFNNFLLAGIEADIQGLSARDAEPVATVVTAATAQTTLYSAKALNWLGTVRGWLGVTIAPALVIYATGGLAYGAASDETTISQGITTCAACAFSGINNSVSQIRTGWAGGGGGEWMFSHDWSLKAEYLYYDLGSVSYSLGALTTTTLDGTTTLYYARARGIHAVQRQHCQSWPELPLLTVAAGGVRCLRVSSTSTCLSRLALSSSRAAHGLPTRPYRS
jgi:opacity protein-like surface antigen